MGLLDDAIREHLDLKRRRGADPTEVARLEQEALGPVRRDPVPAGGGEEPHDEAEHHEHHQPEEHAHDEHPHDGPEREPAAAPAAEEPPAPDPRESDIVHQPTTEFRVEDHHADEDEQAAAHDVDDEQPPHDLDEDVLEETPEFLQETPEHDRLWFEQRPPRDFDFDG